MPYLSLRDWRGGLDSRKFKLAQPAGTATQLVNAHVTQGAEIEKRKAFVKQENPDSNVTTSLPAGTFGMQEVATGLLVFGSSDLSASLFPPPFAYQRLQHPAVYPVAYASYDAAKHALTAVKHSCVFGGKAFVSATFADGYTFAFYDGLIVTDFIAGLILPALAGDNTKIAQSIVNLINATTNYTAVQSSNVANIYGIAGADYAVNSANVTGAGLFTTAKVDDGIEGAEGIPATGQFSITAGTNNAANYISAVTIGATFARAFITNNGTNLNNNDTVTVNGKVYTFKTALTPTEGEVLIGSNADNSLKNLISAINHTGVANTDYKCAAINPDARAVETPQSGVITLIARTAGTAGNSLTLAEASVNLTVSGATFSGGTASTSLITANVLYTDSPEKTASLVANAINSNSGTSGFTASASGNTVFIKSAANSFANGASVSVTAAGNVCIGICAIQFSQPGATSDSITSIRINTAIITTSSITWAGNLSTLVTDAAANINANSGTSGYLACALGTTLYLSKVTTSSDDKELNVAVVFTTGNVLQTSTPGTTPIIVRNSLTNTFCALGPFSRNLPRRYLPSAVVTCLATGGQAPYRYLWIRQDGSDKNFTVGSGGNALLAGSTSTLPSVVFRFTGQPNNAKGAAIRAATFVCQVTDALGASVTGPQVTVFAE